MGRQQIHTHCDTHIVECEDFTKRYELKTSAGRKKLLILILIVPLLCIVFRHFNTTNEEIWEMGN